MIFTRWWRQTWWWTGSLVKKHGRIILIASLATIIGFWLIRNVLPLLPQFKPREKIGIVGQYRLNSLPWPIRSRLGRGLFKLTPSGGVEPDMAAAWETDEAETRYRVSLVPGLTWNDQTPILSRDLKFDLPDVRVDYPDESTLEFSLSQPYAPFLTLLTQPLFKNKTIGAGSYSVKQIAWQGQWLKRLSLVGPDKEVDYRFYPSSEAAWSGFRLGEVDRLENLLVNPLDSRWANRVNLEKQLNTQSFVGIWFNLDDQQLNNKSLRQALAYAIREKAPDPASRALSPIAPSSWAYNPRVKPYDFNPIQAKELLDKFAEEASSGGRLSLTLGTSSSFLSLAEAVAASWREVLNLDVQVKIINSLDSGWQAVLAAQEIPWDPDQHALWHSTQPTNITHYSDLKVDKLLEDGRQISDPGQRREIYQDFQRFLVEDSPAIFLYHPTVYTISRK